MATLASLGLKKQTALNVLGMVGVVLLVAAGFAFVYSVSVARVTSSARDLHLVDTTMSTAGLARAELVQATTLGELAGVAAASDIQLALDRVRSASDELERLAGLGEDRDSYAHLAGYIGTVGMVVTTLQDGEFTTAGRLVGTDLEGSYSGLVDALQTERQTIEQDLEGNAASGRATVGWVMFILILAVPAAVIGGCIFIARRRAQAQTRQNEVELEVERATHRSKDEFIAALSHELRTPLTAIYGYAAIQAEGEIGGADAVREIGQIMASEAAEMTRMVDDLLIASSLTSNGVQLEIGQSKLHDIIESAVRPYERAGRTIERDPTSLFVNADPDRLRHILVNLVSNAVKHGGPAVGVNVAMNDESVEIEVWDNGRGLETDQADRVLERFIRGGSDQLLVGSVGLGLAVAARLTALMGGELKYQRFANRTFFVVSLRRPVVEQLPGADDADDVASMIRALSA